MKESPNAASAEIDGVVHTCSPPTSRSVWVSGATTSMFAMNAIREWMGNSAAIVLKHYHEIVDAEAAREYWSIKPVPRTDRKIVAVA